jgi:micrococcal nuclease
MKLALVSHGLLAMLVILTSCGTPLAPAGELETTIAELETQLAQATPEKSLSPAPGDTPIPSAAPAATATQERPMDTPTPAMTEARVTRIIDGDTIEVEIGGFVFGLRYIGIDCPEPGQPHGDQATQANRQLVEGKTVLLEKDISDADGEGRLLRYVHVGEIFVNAELVRLGYATASTYPPDVRYSDLFAQLAMEAKEAARGLWAAPTPSSESS